MSDDVPLDQLLALQKDLVDDFGVWGAASLRANTADALAIAGPGGNDAKLEAHSRYYRDVAREVDNNMTDLRKLLVRIPDVAIGLTGTRLSGLLHSMGTTMEGAMNAALDISGALLRLAAEVETSHRREARGVEMLTQAHAIAKELTAWGAVFDPFSYDGEQMIKAHHLAMDGIAERVAAHTLMKEGSARLQEFFKQLNEKARLVPLYRVDGGGIERPRHQEGQHMPVSEMLRLLDVTAGDAAGTKILSVEDLRHFTHFKFESQADYDVAMQAIKDGDSPEHRAYLLRAVTLGYDGARLQELNQLIGAHGTDPAWMREHLTFLR